MMIDDIWMSYRRMPLWVQYWVAYLLVPLNLAPILFWPDNVPYWGIVVLLSLGGVALNLPILLMQRGFSRAMALPHVLLWTPLVLLVIPLIKLSGTLDSDAQEMLFLDGLLVVNVISLAFDYGDALKWWRGDRAVF